MQMNKIFAAILVAGIVAMAAGILSEELFHVPKLKQDAFPVAGVDATPGAAPVAEVKIEAIAPLMAKADAAKGAQVVKVCSACHSFDKGGPNKVGPVLYGVIGRTRGTADGYAYSDAMKAKGGAWDAESLNQFLAAPKKFVEGTKMGFMGLPKPQDRADVIKYLETLK